MKVILLIIVIASLLCLYISINSSTIKLPNNYIETTDRGQYELLFGTDAGTVFKYYSVPEMHGLSLQGAIKRMAEGGSYIDGLTNYHPKDKSLDLAPNPFLFLNISSLQNNYSEHQVYTCVMHETMHMAGILYGGRWDSHEEEMITWAEKEANEIITILKSKKYIK
jgi:hypothetical protein